MLSKCKLPSTKIDFNEKKEDDKILFLTHVINSVEEKQLVNYLFLSLPLSLSLSLSLGIIIY